MNKILTLWLILVSSFGFSQSYFTPQRQVIRKPTNRELYKLEYELKHYAFGNGDSTILDGINFELLPVQREQSVDVEVYDPSIGQTIILYSFDKIRDKYLEK